MGFPNESNTSNPWPFRRWSIRMKLRRETKRWSFQASRVWKKKTWGAYENYGLSINQYDSKSWELYYLFYGIPKLRRKKNPKLFLSTLVFILKLTRMYLLRKKGKTVGKFPKHPFCQASNYWVGFFRNKPWKVITKKARSLVP